MIGLALKAICMPNYTEDLHDLNIKLILTNINL